MGKPRLPIAMPGNLEVNLKTLFTDIRFTPNDQGKAENFDAEIITVTSDVAEFVVPHKLERIPNGFLVMNKDGIGDVWDSGTAWTDEHIFLASDVIGVTLKLLII